jgi:hypothetical protein
VKSVEYNEFINMMFLARDYQISKREINILQVGNVSFCSFCLRRERVEKSNTKTVVVHVYIYSNVVHVIVYNSKQLRVQVYKLVHI